MIYAAFVICYQHLLVNCECDWHSGKSIIIYPGSSNKIKYDNELCHNQYS